MVWKSTFVTILILHVISLGAGQDFESGMPLESSFPPVRPSVNNLEAVCHLGSGRPKYAAHRPGQAVNRLEAWFSQCCTGGLAHEDTLILCCLQQAWETALSQFCLEDFSTMTLAHGCCEKKGEERCKCFQRQAANPSYQPLSGYKAPIIPPDLTFTWNPNNC